MRSRGQALAELSLALTALVTVLLVGIQLAEVATLSIKATRGVAGTMFSGAAMRVQDPGIGLKPLTQMRSDLRLAVQRSWRQEHGQLNDIAPPGVTCVPDGTLSFPPPVALRNTFFDEGGMRCQMEVATSAARMPKRYLEQDQGGFFSAAHFRTLPIHLCAIGRASGGACRGGLPVLFNDWGLSGLNPDNSREFEECDLGRGCKNPTYRRIVQRMWQPGFPKGRLLAEKFAGPAPDVANEFWFSYAGEEHDHITRLGSEQGADWNTGGPGIGLLPARNPAKCFLGRGPCT